MIPAALRAAARMRCSGTQREPFKHPGASPELNPRFSLAHRNISESPGEAQAKDDSRFMFRVCVREEKKRGYRWRLWAPRGAYGRRPRKLFSPARGPQATTSNTRPGGPTGPDIMFFLLSCLSYFVLFLCIWLFFLSLSLFPRSLSQCFEREEEMIMKEKEKQQIQIQRNLKIRVCVSFRVGAFL